MKRKILALLASAAMCVSMVACSSPEPEECISDISLFAIEDGVAYYDVYLTDDIDWPDMTSGDQSDIALYAINKCRSMEKSTRNDCNVTGYQDGVIAFSWGGVDGITKIRMYNEEGALDYTWELSADDWEL